MTLGLRGQPGHPKVVEAQEKTIRMALKYDRHPRAEVESTDGFEKAIKRYIDLGVRDFLVGCDVITLYEWMKKYGGITRKLLTNMDT